MDGALSYSPAYVASGACVASAAALAPSLAAASEAASVPSPLKVPSGQSLELVHHALAFPPEHVSAYVSMRQHTSAY